MQLPENIKSFVEEAEQKALGTCCQGEVNVVPVSVVRMVGDKIHLHDFFMQKTTINICEAPRAALALWSGLKGVQIKGTTLYEVEGERFEESKQWIAENHPHRELRGLIIFTPEEVYDVSAEKELAGKQIV